MPEKQDIMQHIRALRGGLKPSLQSVADYVLSHSDTAKSMGIKELAEACAVSEASISRFVRGVGMKNYRAFNINMTAAHSGTNADLSDNTADGVIYENIGRKDNASTIMTKIVHRHAHAVKATLSTLDPVVLEAGALLVANSQSILLLAAGSSCLAAESAVIRFGRIGKPTSFGRDSNTQLLLAASLPKGALAIAISDSGRTTQTVAALSVAREAGAKTIAVTSYADAPLVRCADVVLLTPPAYEPSGEEPLYENMVSKVGQLLAIDALYSLTAVKGYDGATSRLRRGDHFIRSSRTARRSNDTY